MAGRVGGPAYLSGSSLGIAGAAASPGGAAGPLADRDAEEHPASTVTEHASTDQKDFTITPCNEEPGQAVGAYPGVCKTDKATLNHIQAGPSAGPLRISRCRSE